MRVITSIFMTHIEQEVHIVVNNCSSRRGHHFHVENTRLQTLQLWASTFFHLQDYRRVNSIRSLFLYIAQLYHNIFFLTFTWLQDNVYQKLIRNTLFNCLTVLFSINPSATGNTLMCGWRVRYDICISSGDFLEIPKRSASEFWRNISLVFIVHIVSKTKDHIDITTATTRGAQHISAHNFWGGITYQLPPLIFFKKYFSNFWEKSLKSWP